MIWREILDEIGEQVSFFKKSFYRVIGDFVKNPQAVVAKVVQEPKQQEYAKPVKHLRISLLLFFTLVYFSNKYFPGIPIQTTPWTLETHLPKAVYESLQALRASAWYEVAILLVLLTIGSAVGVVTSWVVKPPVLKNTPIFLAYTYSVGILANSAAHVLLVLRAWAALTPQNVRVSTFFVMLCLFVWPAVQYARFFRNPVSERFMVRKQWALFGLYFIVAYLIAMLMVIGLLIYLDELGAVSNTV